MILATAQINPWKKKVGELLEEHLRLSELAANNGASVILFPEMSVTGYKRKLKKSGIFSVHDKRLSRLRQLAEEKSVFIIVGAPVQIDDKVFIASLIIQPDRKVIIYTKQFLHKGEEETFCSSSFHNPLVKINNDLFSLAICYDIENEIHVKSAKDNGASFYAPSIFYTSSGIPGAHLLLSDYARKNVLNVIMANYCGEVWGLEAGGGSGFWDTKGRLVASLDHHNPGLLFIEKKGERWIGKSMYL